MEQHKLPNTTISLVLGIISYIACCLTSGFGGLVLSGIALYLANKDLKAAQPDTSLYENFNTAKTAKIIAIVGLVLAAITAVISIVFIIIFGSVEAVQAWAEEMQAAQQ
ncbi:CCC motif membrane protein [Flavimarina sp. Hel_I_48]|uniref:CCC motif membrane protein n=1 Tax=Flavimarina sp. Hel_I_48 TaxID=1392488 RepID=UPI0004DFC62D|nr:CCC motif membrane protein [Flavimarina sp. Hel_I_48]